MLAATVAATLLGWPAREHGAAAGSETHMLNRTYLMERCPRCSEEGIDALDRDEIQQLTAKLHAAELAGRAVNLHSFLSTTGLPLFLAAHKCYNSCSGHGECSLGLCTCDAGFGAADCAEGAPREESKDAFIYVYDIPPELGLSKLRENLGDPLYAAEAFFLESLMSDPSLRTTDPKKAKLFYVPTHFYFAVNNVGFPDVHFMQLKQHLKHWGKNAAAPNGEDHVFFFTNDKGACGAPRGPIYITHFGYMKPWACMGREGTSACKQLPWNSPNACSDTRSIVVPPYGFSLGPTDVPVVRHTLAALPRDERGHPVYPYLLSFSGGIRETQAPAYSQNVRQTIYRLFAEGNPKFSITEGVSEVDIFGKSKFCLAPSGDGWGVRTVKSLATGCVPLIIQPSVRQPFDDIYNYSEFALILNFSDIPDLEAILEAVPPETHAQMLKKGAEVVSAFYYEDQGGGAYLQRGKAGGLIVQSLRKRAAELQWRIDRPPRHGGGHATARWSQMRSAAHECPVGERNANQEECMAAVQATADGVVGFKVVDESGPDSKLPGGCSYNVNLKTAVFNQNKQGTTRVIGPYRLVCIALEPSAAPPASGALQLHSEDEEQDEEGARQQQRWQSRKPTQQRKLGSEV